MCGRDPFPQGVHNSINLMTWPYPKTVNMGTFSGENIENESHVGLKEQTEIIQGGQKKTINLSTFLGIRKLENLHE